MQFSPARRYASAALAMVMCLCVCVSITVRYCIEMAERIELVFGTDAFIDQSYTVLEETSDISKNKGASLWNIVPNCGLKCCSCSFM